MREFKDGSIQYNKLEGIFLQAGHKMGDHNVNRFLDMWDPERDDDLLMWWKISYGIGQEEYKKSLTQAQIFSDTVLDPKNCFSLKSPNTKDASEYTMFGWFSYEDFSTILNKYQFTEEQKKVLETWAQRYYSAFAINGQGEWEGKHNAELESLQNMVRMRELSNEYYGYDRINRHQKFHVRDGYRC